MKSTKVTIKNMTCHACEKVVSKKLSGIAGVQGVTVDVPNGSAAISAHSGISRQDIEKALAGTHYQVVSVE